MKTTSTIQLHEIQRNTPSSHRSSLTLYAQENPSKPLLPCLAERKTGGKISIVPHKMTNGVNSRISEPIDIRGTQKTTSQNRGGKIYVSCLETSLSTTWKRSLSQESDKKDIKINLQEMSFENPKATKRTDSNKAMRVSKGNNIGSGDDIDSKLAGVKEKGKRKAGKGLERQDSNVSIQLSKGKQINVSSEGKSSFPSHSETNLTAPSLCIPYAVHVKSKSHSQQTNTVLIQKFPLCRSITISETKLSSTLSRQGNINLYSKPSPSRISRNSPRHVSGINVQNRNKRSFTISNDTTDGRLRTIYESTMEDLHE